MPLLKLQTSQHVAAELRKDILAAASRIIADVTGKPEKYTMVALDEGSFLFGGKPGPAAFADVRGIGGLSSEVNKRLTLALCDLCRDKLGIPPERVYVTFTDVPATNWGWNGATFG